MTAPTLPPDGRTTLESEGWLFIRQFLDGDTVKGLVRASEALESSATTLVRDTVMLGVGFEVQSATGRRGEPAVMPGALRKIALDEADAGNGGFEVLGRTHTGGLVEFSYDPASMNEGIFDETHRTLVPMQPGDAVLFHPLLAHGSGQNRSDRPRRLVTMWFRG